MRCNLVLEGGGAKGLAHIGALKALDDYKIKIGNVSGTSAGAIAVALFASGYTPDDMYNPKTGTGIFPDNLLSIILKNKKDKLCLYSYVAIIITYILVLWAGLWLFIPTKIYAILLSIYTLILIILPNISFNKKSPPIKALIETFLILFSIITLSPMVLISVPFFWHFGLLSTNGVREWLIDTLKKSPKLKGVDNIEDVTLGEFYKLTHVNLKIIATDLTNKKLVAFSGDNQQTNDIKLIDSIIASMCIPIVFKCCDIKSKHYTSRFVDGGMLSNFPAWVHRKNLLMSELTHTIGIKIFDNKFLLEKTPTLDTPLSYIKSIVQTALWGSSSIENISVRALVNIPINTGNVTTLKFNLKDSEKKELYNSAYKQTISCLEKNYTLFPSNSIKSWLEIISTVIGKVIFQEQINDNVNIRSSLSSYVDTDLNISKLIHTYNMDNDIDKHLEFSYEEGVSGISLRTGQPLSYLTSINKAICIQGLYLTSQQKKQLNLPGSRNQLVNKNVDFILSIPLFDPDELTEKNAFYYTEDDGFPLIDFKIVTKKRIQAKACLNVDFSNITVLDNKKNNVLLERLNTTTYQTMLRLLSGLGTNKISELSKFKQTECHYETN
jgi:predicted acylesterase/phospholipase RssA